ncbi:phage holin family protein [Halomonas piscis]|uniref:phage holin family protein n=1 Tax=Halomonas piscis TaxID=3031727 RepID=UPI0028A0A6A0|nr:phage holin family protein [Halomonas piscis]
MNKHGQQHMPGRDPNIWTLIQENFPHLMVGVATFLMALLRAIQDGGKIRHAVTGAMICTLLSGSLYPVFLWIAESRGWPPTVAFAPCVFLAFLGTDWIRERVDGLYDALVKRFLK